MHTPGPWEAKLYLSESDPPCKTPQVWTSDGMLICTIPAAARFDYANARLIAAAPDLLEACKAVLQWMESGNNMAGVEWNEYFLTRKAIAKAEGG